MTLALPLEHNSLWHMVIANKYGPHPYEWGKALTGTCGRIFLRSFLLLLPLFVVLVRGRRVISKWISGWGIDPFTPCLSLSFFFPLKIVWYLSFLFGQGVLVPSCFGFVVLYSIGKQQIWAIFFLFLLEKYSFWEKGIGEYGVSTH